MPTFCYNDKKTGELIHEVFPSSRIPEKITRGGVTYHRCRQAEWAGQGGARPSCWPMKSNALAVHPDQRKEYSKFAVKHGVPTYFDERGKPEFSDRNHRKKYCELVGAVDYEGGYGDSTG